ncbi:signal peptidase I [Inhella sp.]|jgi:signal peptidase I|uniref:signal peptidase I n=2 Tax=Inhella sp. TaxID=1921806 RepID=UPI00345C0F55
MSANPPNEAQVDGIARLMSSLTAALFAALAVYAFGWIRDLWTGNFALLLFVLSLVTFAYWLAERFCFLPQRRRAAEALVAADAERRAKWAAQGLKADVTDIEGARQALLRQPWWLDWTAGLFPVLLAVFLLRSFVFEPFRIPSGSMVPTLLVGDLIVVNKFHYGIRLPVINKKIVDNHPVQRGDVMVFRYPKNPAVDYIKRVVAVPGDVVTWRNQKLYLNGQEVPTTLQGPFYDRSGAVSRTRYTEQLGALSHDILVERHLQPLIPGDPTRPHADQCQHTLEGLTCTVPPGHYFMMGDSRDNSEDSRFWGFVPDENIVGKASAVWMHFWDFSRIGPIR